MGLSDPTLSGGAAGSAAQPMDTSSDGMGMTSTDDMGASAMDPSESMQTETDPPATTTEPAGDHCLAGITGYTEDGPFSFEAVTSGSVKMRVPVVPAGCKVPVVHLANGTGASCSSYLAVLEHLASHGFLAACYEDRNTGQGTQCITAIETARSEYPDLADDKIGSTGHSQGGGAAVVCIYRAEAQWGDSMIYAGHAMEPAHGYGDAPADYASLYAQIESPIFMFNGSSDTLVSARWVGEGFDALSSSVEAYWYQAQGADHIPIPTRWTEESTVAWFRWKLLGDTQACQYFKDMPNSSDWTLQDSQNETDCQ
ncbi:MAG: hypothetical protein OEZ06_07000 [Myxococcales bacterium]|nr:hypothetical protein [Myxococcales bacterium]